MKFATKAKFENKKLVWVSERLVLSIYMNVEVCLSIGNSKLCTYFFCNIQQTPFQRKIDNIRRNGLLNCITVTILKCNVVIKLTLQCPFVIFISFFIASQAKKLRLPFSVCAVTHVIEFNIDYSGTLKQFCCTL